ncbi:MAG: putative stomatin/prohibitin-family rane protease [Myxococcaceae bacterium]|nr:putative stomatin/prohibitin-family rane protease [Myxococcaceae bacterium]
MNSAEVVRLVLGVLAGIAVIPLLVSLGRALTVAVDDEDAVLVTAFGRLVRTIRAPGLHWLPARLLPWVSLRTVSLRRDFRLFDDVHVNDARGTTLMVDLWLEFRIDDPARALFGVADWDRALHNLVSHAATSILGNREFSAILSDRTELGERLKQDISDETARWGLKIERVFIRNVKLLPEVSRQIFGTIAARLERAKAAIDENGRLAASRLEADTGVRVAALVAEAKSAYPLAVGRALAALRGQPEVLAAYQELYSLSLLRPHRTVAFRGFEGEAMRAVDAAMLSPSGGEATGIAPLNGHGERVLNGR